MEANGERPSTSTTGQEREEITTREREPVVVGSLIARRRLKEESDVHSFFPRSLNTLNPSITHQSDIEICFIAVYVQILFL
ncbi:hypothetical protein AMEX_G16016 [Astyanax mexicanus]|uniref:Uncharacterized protein n=1 Tax=Astyanax mexicanus TaxID=7994 RepID=A0A8T2LBM3_ASTMX|nr:hypothetical protein AMEX_G16016 [Astyanax mexicanus]